jgi:methanogenic corrinoid protein MtbC1
MVPNQDEGKFNIKAISKIVGIQPGTLRAWERRYKMVEPVRNVSGHRLYSDEHVQILKWLVSRTNQGFTISQAVSLLEKQQFGDTSFSINSGDNLKQLSNELVQALLSFNEAKSQELINQAFSIYTVDMVVIDILGSVLVEIGNMWEKNEITTAHEHYATSILRSRIDVIMHSFPHNGMLPKVVAVCGPGESHELGLLIFTLFVRRKGFEVIYLGSSIKEEDLDVVLNTVDAKFLFLSCTLKENVAVLLKLVDQLTKNNPDLCIGMGGSAIDHLSTQLKDQYEISIVGKSKDSWEKWMMENMTT